MKPILSHAIRLVTLLMLFSSNSHVQAMEPVQSPSEQGHIEMTANEASYQAVHASVVENMNKLEALGGGMKPLRNYLKQIDQTFTNGDVDKANKQITTLDKSVAQQLKKVSELRSRKRRVQAVNSNPVPQAPGMSLNGPTQEPLNVLLNALNKAKQKEQAAPRQSIAKFNGSSNAYLQHVVKDIVQRELAGVQLPCKAPFRLERFRIAQRISELKKQGQDVRNYEAYYNRTESIARQVRNNPRRIAELSSNVRYLGQQLQLPPLTGSVTQKIFR